MEKGVQIIENNVMIEDMNACWQICGHFVLEEPAGVREKISRERLEKREQEEESGLPDERN